MLHGEAFIYDYEKKLPSYNCQSSRFKNLTKEESVYDYNLDWFRRNGDWTCFCSKSVNLDSAYCKYYERRYLLTLLIGLVIPLIMGIGDLLVELSVQFADKFLKPTNETSSLN